VDMSAVGVLMERWVFNPYRLPTSTPSRLIRFAMSQPMNSVMQLGLEHSYWGNVMNYYRRSANVDFGRSGQERFPLLMGRELKQTKLDKSDEQKNTVHLHRGYYSCFGFSGIALAIIKAIPSSFCRMGFTGPTQFP